MNPAYIFVKQFLWLERSINHNDRHAATQTEPEQRSNRTNERSKARLTWSSLPSWQKVMCGMCADSGKWWGKMFST